MLTGGAVYGKHYKRAVARQHHTRGGQQNELKGDERAPWVHGTAYAFKLGMRIAIETLTK